jgi:hypothetical protein
VLRGIDGIERRRRGKERKREEQRRVECAADVAVRGSQACMEPHFRGTRTDEVVVLVPRYPHTSVRTVARLRLNHKPRASIWLVGLSAHRP